MRMTYLACPYSHPDPAVRQARFEAVNRVAARLIREGILMFSPISHSHPLAVCGGLPGGFAYWETHNRAWMERCDDMIVLMLDGWRDSRGVRDEIAIMEEAGKAVVYLEEEPNPAGYANQPGRLGGGRVVFVEVPKDAGG